MNRTKYILYKHKSSRNNDNIPNETPYELPNIESDVNNMNNLNGGNILFDIYNGLFGVNSESSGGGDKPPKVTLGLGSTNVNIGNDKDGTRRRELKFLGIHGDRGDKLTYYNKELEQKKKQEELEKKKQEEQEQKLKEELEQKKKQEEATKEQDLKIKVQKIKDKRLTDPTKQRGYESIPIKQIKDQIQEEPTIKIHCTKKIDPPAGFDPTEFDSPKFEEGKTRGTNFEGTFAKIIPDKTKIYVYKKFKERDDINKECDRYNLIDKNIHDDKRTANCAFIAKVIPEEFATPKERYLKMNNIGVPLTSEIEKMSSADYIRIAKQILSQLECLHNNGLAHLDLWADNILIQSNDATIIDYGLLVDNDMAKTQVTINRSNIYYKYIYNRNITYAQLSDIWAFGILLLKLLNHDLIAQSFNLVSEIILDRLKTNFSTVTVYTFSDKYNLLQLILYLLKYTSEKDQNRIKLINVIIYIFDALGINDNTNIKNIQDAILSIINGGPILPPFKTIELNVPSEPSVYSHPPQTIAPNVPSEPLKVNPYIGE